MAKKRKLTRKQLRLLFGFVFNKDRSLSKKKLVAGGVLAGLVTVAGISAFRRSRAFRKVINISRSSLSRSKTKLDIRLANKVRRGKWSQESLNKAFRGMDVKDAENLFTRSPVEIGGFVNSEGRITLAITSNESFGIRPPGVASFSSRASYDRLAELARSSQANMFTHNHPSARDIVKHSSTDRFLKNIIKDLDPKLEMSGGSLSVQDIFTHLEINSRYPLMKTVRSITSGTSRYESTMFVPKSVKNQSRLVRMKADLSKSISKLPMPEFSSSEGNLLNSTYNAMHGAIRDWSKKWNLMYKVNYKGKDVTHLNNIDWR
jgi:hypothetical protein